MRIAAPESARALAHSKTLSRSVVLFPVYLPSAFM
jgi:hypothetical protein